MEISPVEILGDEHKFVIGMKCVEMELGEPMEARIRRTMERDKVTEAQLSSW